MQGDQEAVRFTDASHVGRQLAEYAQRLPEVKSELRKRSSVIPGRVMLEHFFGEAASDGDLLALVEN